MDFFGHQDRARRKTGLLVFLFLMAVVCIVIAIYLLASAVFAAGAFEEHQYGAEVSWFRLDVLAGTCLMTAILVGGAALYKIADLSGGGKKIAIRLGGRPLPAATTEHKERQLLNVVEEVAIASGVAVPPVYVLEHESAINAFAAGYGPTDAVIGVTRGCLEQLSRDELQGVIAHEFSHILNGDMRMNIRLIGVLFGITCITTTGYVLLRVFGRSRGGKNNAGTVAVLLGVGLLVIGWIGSLFASLIRAAVSRQREFLADASAVQFTRSPAGIGGALRKIAGYPSHARLVSAHATDCSHMFFGNALRKSFLNLWATHPPIELRIKVIDPSFDFEQLPRNLRELRSERLAASAGFAAAATGTAAAAGIAGSPAGETLEVTPEQLIETVGRPEPGHLAYATELRGRTDPRLGEMVRDELGARAVAYALLLDAAADVRERQFALIQRVDPHAVKPAQFAAGIVAAIDRADRLPLLGVATGALRQLGSEQYRSFREAIAGLISADQQVTLFEFALERVLARNLRATFEKPPSRRIRHHSLRSLRQECRVVLSALAHAGGENDAGVENAYQSGGERIAWAGTAGPPGLLPRRDCDLVAVAAALDEIDKGSPAVKRMFVAACAATVSVDGKVTTDEVELLRAIVEGIDCPMPPLLVRGDGRR